MSCEDDAAAPPPRYERLTSYATAPDAPDLRYERGWKVAVTCAICMTDSFDVRPLVHANQPSDAGDLSAHAMCEGCRRQWPDACPFCLRPLVRDVPPPPPPYPPPPLSVAGTAALLGLPRFDGPPAPRAPRARAASVPSSLVADHPAPVLARVAAASTDAVVAIAGERRRKFSDNVRGLLRRRSMPAWETGRRTQRPRTCRGCPGGCMICDPDGYLMELDWGWPSV